MAEKEKKQAPGIWGQFKGAVMSAVGIKASAIKKRSVEEEYEENIKEWNAKKDCIRAGECAPEGYEPPSVDALLPKKKKTKEEEFDANMRAINADPISALQVVEQTKKYNEIFPGKQDPKD
jgi:hypothetical protein